MLGYRRIRWIICQLAIESGEHAAAWLQRLPVSLQMVQASTSDLYTCVYADHQSPQMVIVGRLLRAAAQTRSVQGKVFSHRPCATATSRLLSLWRFQSGAYSIDYNGPRLGPLA